MEDISLERNRSNETRRALLNILGDVEPERMRAERAKELLAAANKEMEAFSYSVSHDLQAPLRSISGFAEAVVEDYAPLLDERGKHYLNLIQESAVKMGQLINDLLSFSRLSRQEMLRTEVNMENLAKEVFEELLVQTKNRKIKFLLNPIPPCHGDRAMIRQVLVNLFSNAIKFTKTKEKAFIEFGYMSGLKGGTYYVKDNGVGFDMKYVHKLFGVFQRLHVGTEFEGTGVGLALVSRIISRHGGQTWAEGKVGQGAIIYFTIPYKEKDKSKA